MVIYPIYLYWVCKYRIKQINHKVVFWASRARSLSLSLSILYIHKFNNYDLEGACFQNEGPFHFPQTQGIVHKPRLATTSLNFTDMVSNASEDDFFG